MYYHSQHAVSVPYSTCTRNTDVKYYDYTPVLTPSPLHIDVWHFSTITNTQQAGIFIVKCNIQHKTNKASAAVDRLLLMSHNSPEA